MALGRRMRSLVASDFFWADGKAGAGSTEGAAQAPFRRLCPQGFPICGVSSRVCLEAILLLRLATHPRVPVYLDATRRHQTALAVSASLPGFFLKVGRTEESRVVGPLRPPPPPGGATSGPLWVSPKVGKYLIYFPFLNPVLGSHRIPLPKYPRSRVGGYQFYLQDLKRNVCRFSCAYIILVNPFINFYPTPKFSPKMVK